MNGTNTMTGTREKKEKKGEDEEEERRVARRIYYTRLEGIMYSLVDACVQ